MERRWGVRGVETDTIHGTHLQKKGKAKDREAPVKTAGLSQGGREKAT